MKILLVVDLQREFRDNLGNYERILEFVNNAKKNGYDKIIATVCKNSEDSAFVRYNNWKECLDGCLPLEFSADVILYKTTYGLTDYSILSKDSTYDIVGFNTGACVLKIAMDMFDRNYDMKVLTKYCFSSDGVDRHNNAKEMLKHLMSDAIDV